jgi:hypothetical protein
MTTFTVKINKKTKAGKAFLVMAETFFKDAKGIEITENESKEESPYDPEFVKKVLDSYKNDATTTLDPNDIWGSLGLK